MAAPARLRPRHRKLFAVFLAVVVLPILATAAYMYIWASDQYSSTLAFTMRSEDSASAATDLLGGLGSTIGGTNSASDSDVLYEFVRSQDMVRAVDAQVDLRTLYSRPGSDRLMRFDPDGTIEDLTNYWQRMTRISYDGSTGLMEIRALAFRPDDAQAIASAINDEATRLVNELSAQSREDAIRYAREDLDTAVDRLKTAREALTAFRIQNQIVDVNADLQGQTGIVASLQSQLATALVDLDLLRSSTGADDPRVRQAETRIGVIQDRIASERQKFSNGSATATGDNYANVVAEYERLTVDREFAETAYTSALAAYDSAVAEANRRTRYLAAYIRPTAAEKSEYPQRALITGLVALFSFLTWAIGALIYYSLRDRR
ncbi:sugar transporter [Falsirhodobacter algicola]|uniref:Sugar transporter n=1 Tax=Falsirhodobacter algicola TaxID=2692330 RepID=A0A8J8MUX5_9RHOB|nr:sugar transporter [Falsirhodobacter algicola]